MSTQTPFQSPFSDEEHARRFDREQRALQSFKQAKLEHDALKQSTLSSTQGVAVPRASVGAGVERKALLDVAPKAVAVASPVRPPQSASVQPDAAPAATQPPARAAAVAQVQQQSSYTPADVDVAQSTASSSNERKADYERDARQAEALAALARQQRLDALRQGATESKRSSPETTFFT